MRIFFCVNIDISFAIYRFLQYLHPILNVPLFAIRCPLFLLVGFCLILNLDNMPSAKYEIKRKCEECGASFTPVLDKK